MIESKEFGDCIYNWNFKDDASVVNNEGVKATKVGTPTFSGGICLFGNGVTNTTDCYKLKQIVNLGTKFSVSVRFKLNAINADYAILAYDGAMYVAYIIGDRIYSRIGAAAIYVAFTRDTNWHTLDITRNGATAAVYIDNIAKTIVGTVSATQTTSFQVIGAGNTTTFSDKFNGQIEFIRIWTRQLTASEVTNNYYGRTFKSLPYSGNEVLGSELLPSFNLLDGNWVAVSGTTITSANTIDSVGPSGVRHNTVLAANKMYKVVLTASTTAPSIQLWYGYTSRVAVGSLITTTITETVYLFTGGSEQVLYLRNANTGVATINSVSVKEVLSAKLDTLFHITANRGVIRDLVNKVTPVATNVALQTIGSGVKVMKFDGVSGNIALGNNALLGDITFMGWVNFNSYGEGASTYRGIIINNSEFIVTLSITTMSLVITRNGTTLAIAANNCYSFGKYCFLAITSTTTGISNIYIATNKSAPILSGTANQTAGTPETGIAASTYIGNNSVDARTLDGLVDNIRMDASILDMQSITQFWSDTKSLYL